jgi:hypothetical protein
VEEVGDTEMIDKKLRLFLDFGLVDAERFIMLMNRDPFDYTEWQRGLFAEMTLEELNERATAYRRVLNSFKQQELD